MATEGWKRPALNKGSTGEGDVPEKETVGIPAGEQERRKELGGDPPGELFNSTGFRFPVFRVISKPSQVQGYADTKERHSGYKDSMVAAPESLIISCS